MEIDAVISVIFVQDEVKSFRVIAGLGFIPLLGCRLELAISILAIVCVAVVSEELVCSLWCLSAPKYTRQVHPFGATCNVSYKRARGAPDFLPLTCMIAGLP